MRPFTKFTLSEILRSLLLPQNDKRTVQLSQCVRPFALLRVTSIEMSFQISQIFFLCLYHLIQQLFGLFEAGHIAIDQ